MRRLKARSGPPGAVSMVRPAEGEVRPDMPHCADPAPREEALTCARRIFHRPVAVVNELIAIHAGQTEDAYPGDAAIAQICYERPIRMGGTRAVFELRARHWPMLNLLDSADRDRRAFAHAMAAAVAAARSDRVAGGVA